MLKARNQEERIGEREKAQRFPAGPFAQNALGKLVADDHIECYHVSTVPVKVEFGSYK